MLLSTPSLFHDGGPYHIETSPLIYRANQWTIFYVIGASIMKELTLCGICPVQKIQYSFLDEECFWKTFKLKRCLLSYNSVRYQLAAFILCNILEIIVPTLPTISDKNYGKNCYLDNFFFLPFSSLTMLKTISKTCVKIYYGLARL